MKQHIVLVGMPGCGKTSTAKKLARLFKCDWYDLDMLISDSTNKSISQLFEDLGEEKFREIERLELQKWQVDKPSILATGGGTPAFFDNMNYINAIGVSVYLEANEKFLYDRLSSKKDERPMFSGLSEGDIRVKLSKILAQREFFYKKAKYTFKLPIKAIEQLIYKELTRNNSI
ncbi:MAG: AAA family ATPase [Bacteroidia bacterium]|nr:AAA family ATPase [Bacteroidia bacterium]